MRKVEEWSGEEVGVGRREIEKWRGGDVDWPWLEGETGRLNSAIRAQTGRFDSDRSFNFF